MLELGKDLLDRVEVGAVGRKEQQPCAAGPDCCPDGGFLVAGEVVHDDDVARPKRWAQLLLDPGDEAGRVDGLIKNEGSLDPIAAQCCDEGHGLPMSVRHLGMKSLTNRRPTPQRSHVGLSPGLIDEDEAGRVRTALIFLPLLASVRDVGTELFGGKHGFF